MIKTKKMYPGCYYLLKGEASANSCFIENMNEAKLFITLANRYLQKYVKIHEYLLTAEGWMIQVTIRKARKVYKQYEKKRIKSNKPIGTEKEVWFIISEQIRIMLSQYVIKTNRLEGRSGSKVKESYKRYYFESAKEASETVQKMKGQKFRMIQRNKKYRKVKTHYSIPNKIGKGSIFLCSKWIKNKKSRIVSRKNIGFNKLYILDLEHAVLGKRTKNTLTSHLNQNST